MALALAATGYFIYLVEPWTPDAVVVSVIVFNAAFGFRYDDYLEYSMSKRLTSVCYSWGPLPWLYPPEVSYTRILVLVVTLIFFSLSDNASHIPSKGCVSVHSHKLGVQLGGWSNDTLFARSD